MPIPPFCAPYSRARSICAGPGTRTRSHSPSPMRSANRPHRSAPRASMMDAWVASVSSFARTKCWLSQRLSDFGTSQARYALAALSGQAHSLGPREKHAVLRFMLGLPDTPRSQRHNRSSSPKRRRGPRRPALPLAWKGGAPRQSHGEGPGRKRGGIPSIRSRAQGS